MRQSELFFHTQKEAPKDEVSKNAQLLVRAGFVDKLMAGVYTYLPLGLRVLKKIEEIIRKEMILAGGQEVLMPVLQPKDNWMKTGRWKTYDTLFKFASFYSKNEYALGPTHEEVIAPLVGKFSLSYKDLPFSLFQIQTKFRDEKRVKSGLLRGREFLMKDLYSFHISEESLDEYYEKMKSHYENIFNKAGIEEKTFLTFASGGTFSKYSHEFQTITDGGEDKIFLCEKCRVAVNSELTYNVGGTDIVSRLECPECGNKKLTEKKAIEVGNIFKLKTKYSVPFDLKFTDEKGRKKDVIMGCYGIGLGRLMGAIVEINNDEKGIIWPQAVAPFAMHLLLLNNELGIKNEADKLYQELQKQGIEVLYDDRKNISAGEKFVDADLIGIPYRAVVSEKTTKEGKVEVKDRRTGEIKMVDKKQLFSLC